MRRKRRFNPRIRSFEKISCACAFIKCKKGKGYALPDEGILPLESFLTKLKQEGYRGAVSFKIAPKFLQAGDDKKVLKHLAECKKFYEEYYVKIETLPGIDKKKKGIRLLTMGVNTPSLEADDFIAGDLPLGSFCYEYARHLINNKITPVFNILDMRKS